MLDLEAVTMSDVPRRPYRAGGHDVDWAQGTQYVTIWTALPPGTRAKQFDVRITSSRLSVVLRGAHGADTLVDGELGNVVDPAESEWQIVNDELKVHLAKAKHREWITPLLSLRRPSGVDSARDAAAASSATASASPPVITQAVPSACRDAPAVPRPLSAAEAVAAGARSRLADSYASWDRFDQTAALMELENQGKTDDPTSFTVRAGAGAAAMSAEGYKKDAEEVSLDLELEEKRADLRASLMEYYADASRCRELGNERLKAGQPAKALAIYREGNAALSLFDTSAPVLAASLKATADALSAVLHSNAAQAALSAGMWEEAAAQAKAALAKEPGNKKAAWRLQRAQEMGREAGLV
jgi:hypothetical protein